MSDQPELDIPDDKPQSQAQDSGYGVSAGLECDNDATGSQSQSNSPVQADTQPAVSAGDQYPVGLEDGDGDSNYSEGVGVHDDGRSDVDYSDEDLAAIGALCGSGPIADDSWGDTDPPSGQADTWGRGPSGAVDYDDENNTGDSKDYQARSEAHERDASLAVDEGYRTG
jgi:hypothetical protein